MRQPDHRRLGSFAVSLHFLWPPPSLGMGSGRVGELVEGGSQFSIAFEFQDAMCVWVLPLYLQLSLESGSFLLPCCRWWGWGAERRPGGDLALGPVVKAVSSAHQRGRDESRW